MRNGFAKVTVLVRRDVMHTTFIDIVDHANLAITRIIAMLTLFEITSLNSPYHLK